MYEILIFLFYLIFSSVSQKGTMSQTLMKNKGSIQYILRRTHKRVHSNKVKCEECGLELTRKHDLKRHEENSYF